MLTEKQITTWFRNRVYADVLRYNDVIPDQSGYHTVGQVSSHKGNFGHRKTLFRSHEGRQRRWRNAAHTVAATSIRARVGTASPSELPQGPSPSDTSSSDFRLPESGGCEETVLPTVISYGNLGNDFNGFTRFYPLSSRPRRGVPPSRLTFARAPPSPSSAEEPTATQA